MDLPLDELTQLATLSPRLALVEAAPLLRRIAQHYPLPENHEIPPMQRDPTARSLHSDATLNLQLFFWPAASWTPIHDHTSWGIYLCIAGALLEDRYVRLDDATHEATARLGRDSRSLLQPDMYSALLPHAAGIHRVGNPSDRPAVSLHLYGPRLSHLDGRNYDPRDDFVCDRPIDFAA
jgi:predicted metal-dependent enzyme (double-stranded beta helix superfamily)